MKKFFTEWMQEYGEMIGFGLFLLVMAAIFKAFDLLN